MRFNLLPTDKGVFDVLKAFHKAFSFINLVMSSSLNLIFFNLRLFHELLLERGQKVQCEKA